MISNFICRYYKLLVKLQNLKKLTSVPRHSLVLDIGGGSAPFTLADVVCEKFIGDDREREGAFIYDRPLVIGDIEALPFQDQSFDYVVCSHILEHTTEPDVAIAELMRVGKSGYIEVPSEFFEHISGGSPAHLWTVRRGKDDLLIFTPKTGALTQSEVARVFRDELVHKEPLFMAFYWKHHYSIHNIGLYWNKTISCQIMGRHAKGAEEKFDKGTADDLENIAKLQKTPLSHSFTMNPRKWVKKMMRAFHGKNIKSEPPLINIIACPSCKTPVQQQDNNQLICPKCQHKYPFINGIPVLLPK